MARALIDPITNRLVQVESKSFPVAAPFFWVTVPSNVSPETHTYDGTAVVPMPPPDEEPIALARLVELDRLSIRALREYIVNIADAPAELIDIEGQAVAERAKIKPKADAPPELIDIEGQAVAERAKIKPKNNK